MSLKSICPFNWKGNNHLRDEIIYLAEAVQLDLTHSTDYARKHRLFAEIDVMAIRTRALIKENKEEPQGTKTTGHLPKLFLLPSLNLMAEQWSILSLL